MHKRLRPKKDFVNNFADQPGKEAVYVERIKRPQSAAGQALVRLLQMGEIRNSGQIRTLAHFIAARFDRRNFPRDLRTVDVGISEDMLPCLDALCWQG